MNSQVSNSQVVTSVGSMPHYVSPVDQSAAGARDLIRILFKRKKIIMMSALICGGLAAFYAFGRDRDYLANTRILIDPRGLHVVDREIISQNQTNDGGVAIVESQMRVLTSNNVLSKVVDKEGLSEDARFMAGGNGLVAKLGGLLGSLRGGGAPSDPKVKALYKLQDSIRTSRPQRSYIIDLYVKTKDPDQSARLANAIADIYIASEVDERSGLAGRASEMLASRLDELRNQLSTAEEAVERYKVQNNILNSGGSLINEQELTQANQMLGEASGKTAAALAKLEQINSVRQHGGIDQALPEAINSNTITRLRERAAAASQRYQALSVQLLPSHPRMQAMKAEVESANALVNSELKRIAEAAQTEYDRARANEEKIQARINELKGGTYKTNDALVRLRELQRDADSKRAIYESFLVRSRELSEQREVDTNAARIVSRAVAPLDPDGPGGLLILALGLIAGAGLGMLLAFGREALDSAEENARGPYTMPPADPVSPSPNGPAMSPPLSGASDEPRSNERTLGDLPVLATIPIDSRRPGGGELPTFVTEDPASAPAQGIDQLLDNLRPNRMPGQLSSILVTAPGLNHGKTTVALNLALAAARRGEKVLLIDGDPARRSLSMIRAGDPEAGLTDVVSGRARLQDALTPDPTRMVMILPAGRKAGGLRSFAVTAQKIRQAIFAKLPEVSLVVIDGPVSSRAGGLAPYSDLADAICLVVRKGEASDGVLQRSVVSVNSEHTKTTGSAVILDAA